MISTTLALIKSLALQMKGIGTLNIVHHLHLVCFKKKKEKEREREQPTEQEIHYKVIQYFDFIHHYTNVYFSCFIKNKCIILKCPTYKCSGNASTSEIKKERKIASYCRHPSRQRGPQAKASFLFISVCISQEYQEQVWRNRYVTWVEFVPLLQSRFSALTPGGKTYQT